MPQSRRTAVPLWRNLLAGLVATAAVGLTHLDFDPLPVGGSPLQKKLLHAGPPVLPPIVELPTPLADQVPATKAKAPAANVVAVATDDPTTLNGVWAIKMTAALLQRGCESFSRVPDYTATLFKQERIGGALSDGQTIDLKVRHEPFSVYMKWLSGDAGRQLIYVDGQNSGNLLVQPGGIKGRLTGLLSLEPNSDLAMSECRYPVTKAGLVELARTMMELQLVDIERGHGFRCQLLDHQSFGDRPCYLYLIEYDSPQVNATYRKTMAYVDKELSLPVCVKSYTWVTDGNPDKLDEESLIEFYAYTDLKMNSQLTAGDFDETNSKYRLRVKK